MSELVEKMRQARQTWRTVGGLDFLVRRPTELENAALMFDIRSAESSGEGATSLMLRRVRSGVVGWRGVKESDLIGAGGGAMEVPFEADLFVEWVSDRWDLLVELNQICADVVREHNEKKAATAGN